MKRDLQKEVTRAKQSIKYIKHTELKYKIYLFKMTIFLEVTFSSSG